MKTPPNGIFVLRQEKNLYTVSYRTDLSDSKTGLINFFMICIIRQRLLKIF